MFIISNLPPGLQKSFLKIIFQEQTISCFNIKPIYNYLVKYYNFNNYTKCCIKDEVFRNFCANC